MSVNASKFYSGLDAAPTVTLRDAASGAEAASGVTGETSVPLNRLTAYWSSHEPDAEVYEIEFNVTTINSSGGATYALVVYSSDTSGGPRTELARIPSVTAVGTYSLSIDNDQLSPTANFISCGVEISADTPRAIAYGASLRIFPTGALKARR